MTARLIPGDLFARAQTIAGLRALADFLETNPAVPVEEYGRDYTVFTDRNHTGACQRAQLDQIAQLLGQTPVDQTASGGHLVVRKTFGRITYRAVFIPSRALADPCEHKCHALNLRATTDEVA